MTSDRVCSPQHMKELGTFHEELSDHIKFKLNSIRFKMKFAFEIIVLVAILQVYELKTSSKESHLAESQITGKNFSLKTKRGLVFSST